LISWYQNKGGSKKIFLTECNFEPSCSEYTKLAIKKYGVLTGWKLGFDRIKKCNDHDSCKVIHDPLN
jgi:putative component of membrane protein insertase Oxa1/YidC/SpoIIIJ protein YidD